MNPPEHDPDDPSLAHDDADLIQMLQRLGEDRHADTVIGGELWAEFRDFCWAEDEAPDDAMLSVWLEQRGDAGLSRTQLTALKALARDHA